jgi:hypothetical protein
MLVCESVLCLMYPFRWRKCMCPSSCPCWRIVYIFIVLSVQRLMLVCESVLCLMYPFQWAHVYVPILPPMLENCLYIWCSVLAEADAGVRVGALPDVSLPMGARLCAHPPTHAGDVPILPPMLENFLDAPVPYIMGLLRRTNDMNIYCRGSVCIGK